MRKGWILRGLVLAAWVVSMGLLLRFEAYPEWFTGTVAGYKGMLPDSLLARESWSRLLIRGTPAGYSHTLLSVDENHPALFLEINNRLHLEVSLLGQPQRILARSVIHLDHDYALVAFETTVSAGDMDVRATGRRLEHHQFEIKTYTGGDPVSRTVNIPPDTLIYNPVQEFAVRNLRPGGRIVIKTFNPLTLQPASVVVQAEVTEEIQVGGEHFNTTRLSTSWQGMTFHSWIDEQGIIRRQETPLGWVIEACSATEALATLEGDRPPPPLFETAGNLSLFNLIFGIRSKSP